MTTCMTAFVVIPDSKWLSKKIGPAVIVDQSFMGMTAFFLSHCNCLGGFSSIEFAYLVTCHLRSPVIYKSFHSKSM